MKCCTIKPYPSHNRQYYIDVKYKYLITNEPLLSSSVLPQNVVEVFHECRKLIFDKRSFQLFLKKQDCIVITDI